MWLVGQINLHLNGGWNSHLFSSAEVVVIAVWLGPPALLRKIKVCDNFSSHGVGWDEMEWCGVGSMTCFETEKVEETH